MGKRLYVGNLPYDTDEAALRAAFGQDGRVVEHVHLVLDRETQRPRGFAFVEMANDEQAKAAMAALDGTLLGTRQLRVTEAEDRRSPGPGGPSRPSFGGPRPDGMRPPGPRPPRADGSPTGTSRPERGAGGAGPAAGGFAREESSRHRFGPDSRPKHERNQPARKPAKRRPADDDEFRERRGGRYDDDDDE